MKSFHAIITAVAGLILAAVGISGLTGGQEDALRHHRNPFALYGSGYGKIFARLSQDTIDKVWHLGVEQVNPIDHDHHDDHGTDHDHAASGQEHEHTSSAAHGHGAIPAARDWLVDLKATRFDRTNPKSMSEAHRQTVAADIESMLLRGYKMDPTDYGVYNGYFLFLTIHELRGQPIARDHARLVSRNTVACASREDTDPAPWMTATMAVLNLFFLDLEDCRAKDRQPPQEMLIEYRQQMSHCLRQFAVLREKALHEKRWEMIPEEQREAMLERERFALKTFEQFDAMLARQENRTGEKPHAGTEPAEAGTPVAENARDEKAG